MSQVLVASTLAGRTVRLIALVLVVVLALTLSAPARAEADVLAALAIAGAAVAVVIIVVFLVVATSQSGRGEARAPAMLACVDEGTHLGACWPLLAPGTVPAAAPVPGRGSDPQS
jgi:hypothetical protein